MIGTLTFLTLLQLLLTESAAISVDTLRQEVSANGTMLNIPGHLCSFESLPDVFDLFPSLQYVNLSRNKITGHIPPSLGHLKDLRTLDLSHNIFQGSIPPEFGNLSNIDRIDAGFNTLSGPIPQELGLLTKLTFLYLNDNALSGGIPSAFGELTSLQGLYLGNNSLTGSIPLELGRLKSLRILSLEGNFLSGSLPLAHGTFTSVTYLQLGSNFLSGVIPKELPPSLVHLSLANNNLSGFIPTELANLTNITYIFLNFNSLSGVIPPEFAELSRLSVLQLRGNRLSGPIPPGFGSLMCLNILDLAENELSGGIPPELGSLTLSPACSHVSPVVFDSVTAPLPAPVTAGCTGAGQKPESASGAGTVSPAPSLAIGAPYLTDSSLPAPLTLGIYLGSNQLWGPIPPTLGDLSHLIVLDLGNNSLSGSIPSQLGMLTDLTHLYLDRNNLSGTIPPELGNLSNLTVLDLSTNALSSSIPPELGYLHNLTGLHLGSNNLSGTIPSQLCNLSLLSLSLDYNHLSGAIPPELGTMNSLLTLDLFNNSLSGSIPPELSNLTSLKALYLGSNGLTGPIPPIFNNMQFLSILQLGNNQLSGLQVGLLPSLTQLDLSSNKFSGQIPQGLSYLSRLSHMYMGRNQWSGSIPPELGNLLSLTILDLDQSNLSGPIPPALGKLKKLKELYLDYNQLSGQIPPELVDNLHSLSILQLSHNYLTGPIPAAIGQATDLTVLDLSSNALSGPVPPGLAYLSNLSVLDLSSNNLSGAVPYTLGWLSNLTYMDLSGNALEGPIPGSFEHLLNLNALGVPIERALPSWIGGLPSLMYLALGGTISSSSSLDLSVAPSTCQMVRWVGGAVTDIDFWSGCSSGNGCVVDLIGTNSTLSRKTKKQVCLGKISVFVGGDQPELTVDSWTASNGSMVTTLYLAGPYGDYFFNDTNFLNNIDLGQRGLAYTGVDFVLVQHNNLCGNPEAKVVEMVIYGSFVASLFISTCLIWIVMKWRRKSGKGSSQQHPILQFMYYILSLVSIVIPYVDMYLDICVLIEVWGAWPKWVFLASITAPYIVAGFLIASLWVAIDWHWLTSHKFSFKWAWPPSTSAVAMEAEAMPAASESCARLILTLVLWPVGIVGVIFYDLLTIVDTVGVHVAVDNTVYSMVPYRDARAFLEVVVRAAPQAVLQSVVYILGNSRATRVYIDELIFISSICLSLLSILSQYCQSLWQALDVGQPLWVIIRRRIKSCHPIVLKRLDSGSAYMTAKSIDSKEMADQRFNEG